MACGTSLESLKVNESRGCDYHKLPYRKHRLGICNTMYRVRRYNPNEIEVLTIYIVYCVRNDTQRYPLRLAGTNYHDYFNDVQRQENETACIIHTVLHFHEDRNIVQRETPAGSVINLPNRVICYGSLWRLGCRRNSTKKKTITNN